MAANEPGIVLAAELQPIFLRSASVRWRGTHNALTEQTELPGTHGGQHSGLQHRDLLGAFAISPEEQPAVLLLVGVENLSCHGAARVLRVPIGTVMSRLSRGC